MLPPPGAIAHFCDLFQLLPFHVAGQTMPCTHCDNKDPSCLWPVVSDSQPASWAPSLALDHTVALVSAALSLEISLGDDLLPSPCWLLLFYPFRGSLPLSDCPPTFCKQLASLCLGTLTFPFLGHLSIVLERWRMILGAKSMDLKAETRHFEVEVPLT